MYQISQYRSVLPSTSKWTAGGTLQVTNRSRLYKSPYATHLKKAKPTVRPVKLALNKVCETSVVSARATLRNINRLVLNCTYISIKRGLSKKAISVVCLPWHVLAGLPPGKANNRTRMGQVHKGKGCLSLGVDTGFWRYEKSETSRLPLISAVPHLHKAVILERKKKDEYRTYVGFNSRTRSIQPQSISD